MARTKVRNYPSYEEIQEQFEQYLIEHKAEYERYVLQMLGYEDLESLREDDYKMKWGFDCGWVQLHSKNKEMVREWRLDNDGFPRCIFDIGSVVIPTQCCTIKKPIVEKLVEDLNLDKDWYVVTKLD